VAPGPRAVTCRIGAPLGYRPRPVRLRGVPGTFRTGALELYTGRVTVTVYGTEAETRRVAPALRAVDRPADVADRLPPPVHDHPRIHGGPCPAP
jgi:hypothetical protein